MFYIKKFRCLQTFGSSVQTTNHLLTQIATNIVYILSENITREFTWKSFEKSIPILAKKSP